MPKLTERLRHIVAPVADVRPWKDVVSYFVLALTVVPGYFALAAAGLHGKITFSAIAAIGLVLLLIRLTQGFYAQQLLVLKGQIEQADNRVADVSDAFRNYKNQSERERTALARAVDYAVLAQTHFYEEDLRVEVFIGSESSGDRIVEQHVTSPVEPSVGGAGDGAQSRSPGLPFRRFRPLIPSDPGVPVTFADLQLRARIEDESGITADVFSLQETRQAITVMAGFTPALYTRTTWVVEYVSPGLWALLRRDRSDRMVWDLTAEDSGHSPFTRLSVCFVFPQGSHRKTVREVDGYGQIEADSQHALGPSITWTLQHPPARRYQWDVSYGRNGD